MKYHILYSLQSADATAIIYGIIFRYSRLLPTFERRFSLSYRIEVSNNEI